MHPQPPRGVAARVAQLLDGDPEVVRDAIGFIALAGAWQALPDVAPLILDPRHEVGAEARRAVQALLREMPTRALQRLERALIHRSSHPWAPWALTRRGVDELATWPEAPSLLQLATMHGDGYVREAAIRQTRVHSDGREAPFYVLRLNDWVREIRVAAETALRDRLRPELAGGLMSALPLLDVAREWGRAKEHGTVGFVERFVRGDIAAPALRAALADPDPFMRRAAVKRALESVIPAHEVIETAIRDRDTFIRRLTLDALGDRPDVPSEAALATLFADRSSATRSRALALAMRRGQHVELDRFLFDAHADNRSTAQARLLAAGVDIGARYRAALDTASGKRLAAALYGLVETGGAYNMAAMIRSKIDDESAVVRTAALHVLTKLRVRDLAALCVRGLHDPSRAVVREARRGLERHKDVTLAALWTELGSIERDFGRLEVLMLFWDRGFWDGLPFLLDATANDRAAVRARAGWLVERWLLRSQRVFASPNRVQLEAIRGALARAALADSMRTELDAVLRLRPPK